MQKHATSYLKTGYLFFSAAAGALLLLGFNSGGGEVLRFLLPGAQDNAFLFAVQGLALFSAVFLPLAVGKTGGRLPIIGLVVLTNLSGIGALVFLAVISARMTPLTSSCVIKTCVTFASFLAFSAVLFAFGGKWYHLVQGVLLAGGPLAGFFLLEFSRADATAAVYPLTYGNVFAALDSCFLRNAPQETLPFWLACALLWLVSAAGLLLLAKPREAI